ncbi:MAG: hypothetical protein AAFV33_08215 [Chloroflexota bacterium]
MIALEPLARILPGTWTLRFGDEQAAVTGAGEYTFKLAGVFDADVRDDYSGRAHWHGYWQVEDARLILSSQETTSWCSSCMGGGSAHNWTIELERVHETVFSGTAMIREENTERDVIFERVG